MAFLNVQKLSPSEELEIAPGYQRIYVTLNGRLHRHPQARPDHVHKPYLSFDSNADVGFTSVNQLPKNGPQWSKSCYASIIGQSVEVTVPHVSMSVYQSLGYRDRPAKTTSFKHELQLPSCVYKSILRTLLQYPTTQIPHEGDWGGIISYDVPLDATPLSKKIPHFELKNFITITKIYKNVEPIHLHIFNPPRHDIYPDARTFRLGPDKREFLNYPMVSYAFSVRPLGRLYGFLTNPFKRFWRSVRLQRAHYSLHRYYKKRDRARPLSTKLDDV